MTQAKKKTSPPGARWDIWLEHGMCHCDTCGMKIPIEEIRIQQGGKSYHRKQKDLFKRRSGGGAEQGDCAAAYGARVLAGVPDDAGSREVRRWRT